MPNDSSDHVHIIVSGETLGRIAKNHHLDLDALLAANPEIKNPNKVMVGQRVKIPHAAAPAPVMTTPVVTPAPASPAPDAPGTSVPLGGMPDTKNRADAEKYDMYSQFFMRYGVNVNALDPGARVLLGLRITSNTRTRAGAGEYNDRLVVVWRDEGGAKHVKEFVANTEPSSRYEDTPENRKIRPGKITKVSADGDRRGDLGCLPDGLYNYKRDKSGTFGDVLRPISDIFVVRDVDHDGDFDAADQAASVREMLNSHDSILFHKGANSFTGSAGCQTLQPAEFAKFWAALGGQSRFQYALATVA